MHDVQRGAVVEVRGAPGTGPDAGDGAPALKRSLGLPLATLYGLGVTIGAGIYVLIGAAAGRAGMQAPLAFALAALVLAPSAGSFAELSARLPYSAGEAAYVRAGLRSDALAVLTGFLVLAVAVVSAAAISVGSAGYILFFVDLPPGVLVAAVVLLMGFVAAWGITESVALAGVMTLIEVGGLLAVVAVGAMWLPDLGARLPEAWPGAWEGARWSGVLAASLLAVFAFTGFEGLANIAEEVKNPARTLPLAIFATLLLTTLLYVLVVWVALVAVAPSELAASPAPLGLVFERVTGASPAVISGIAIAATTNGVVVFVLMGSRVLYGMAARGLLPAALAAVDPRTRTPLAATLLVIAAVLVLALTFPLEGLAEATSRLTLVIFSLVNASLLALKVRGVPAPAGVFTVPAWVPASGLLCSLALLAGDFALALAG